MHDNPTRVITKDDLPGLLCQAFSSSMKVDTIMTGFRKTGILPFNRLAPVPKNKTIINTIPSKPTMTVKQKEQNNQIQMLLDGAIQPFLEKSVPAKKPRKKFIPPQGALVTTDHYLQEKEAQEAKRKRKAEEAFVPPFRGKDPVFVHLEEILYF